MIVRVLILALSLTALATGTTTMYAVSTEELATSPDTTDADVRANPVFGEDREDGIFFTRFK